MRMIDRDETLGVVMMNMPVIADDEYRRGMADGIAKAVTVIKNQPSARQREKRRGKWMRKKAQGGGAGFAVCSVCGNAVNIVRAERDNFCSNCGAQMLVIRTRRER